MIWELLKSIILIIPDSEIDPEHRSYHDSYSPYNIGRNHIKVYRGKSSPIKGHHDDHYGGDSYFAPWGYHATLTPDSHHKYGGYHWVFQMN